MVGFFGVNSGLVIILVEGMGSYICFLEIVIGLLGLFLIYFLIEFLLVVLGLLFCR